MSQQRDQSLLEAATMYYVENQTMEFIGRKLGVSRSTVSRLLKTARESGLVEISLRSPYERDLGVSHVIGERFGIACFVVSTRPRSSEVERLEQVAMAAARQVADWFGSQMTLGIAWGTTMVAISRHLPSKPTRASTVVQLNGAANMRSSGSDYAGEIISRFGQAFDADVMDFPVPAFFDYPETRKMMWRERSIHHVLEVQQRADIALFSVGAFAGRVPSHVYSGGYLEDSDVEELTAQGVVGDVCTVFLRADGSYADIALNQRASGPTPRQLHSVTRRVCVVAGEYKLNGLLAALRARTATDLIIDDVTAAALLRMPEQ